MFEGLFLDVENNQIFCFPSTRTRIQMMCRYFLLLFDLTIIVSIGEVYGIKVTLLYVKLLHS